MIETFANYTLRFLGQVCFAASRVYVQEGIYDKFIEKYKEMFLEKTKGVGDPDAEDTVLGPLVDEAQFNRVTGFIQRGKEQNQGTLLTGGARIGNSGYFVEPTVFTDVKADAEIHRDEIFGPVSVVRTFKTEEEVMKMSNDSEYGLMAGVFTQDINKVRNKDKLLLVDQMLISINQAMRIAAQFDSGMVGVNCISLMMSQTPFGGSKQSGLGRESGIYALRMFTEPKTIMVNLTY